MLLGELWFSLSRVLPYFLLVFLGVFLRRRGILSTDFFKGANRFAYRVALPASLFMSTYSVDWNQPVDGGFLLYIFICTMVCFVFLWIITEIVFRNQKHLIGTIVQSAFRGNYAILGTPLLLAVLDDSFLPLISLCVGVLIPCYGIFSVIILSIRGVNSSKEHLSPRLLISNIVGNPLVVGCMLGLALSWLRIPLPGFVLESAGLVAASASPLALCSIGGIFSWKLARERLKPAVFATLLKNIVEPVVAVLVSWLLGMQGWQLYFIFIVFANPNSVSAYSTATEIGGDGPLAANVVIMSTLTSALVFALGITFMRSVGWV